ncbi:MAG: AgmX/PglI C-terminal domain-containing protein, partial [Polyangiaceae bacterium]
YGKRSAFMIPVRLPIYLATLSLLAVNACGGSTPPAMPPAEPESESAAAQTHRAELTPAEVVQHLRGNEADLRRCFFANPGLRGALRLAWNLDATGKVHNVRRESSTMSDPRVEACISERLSDIRFGDLAAPARAHWTFVFRLVDPPATPKRDRKAASGKKKKSLLDDDRGLVIDPNSTGVLAEDAIDNVITAGYPLYARCYRDGVSRNNALDGTVRLHFVVGAAGSVSEVRDGGSDLTDRQVVDCIAEGFYALRFPDPQRGSVQVLYRIGFEAG